MLAGPGKALLFDIDGTLADTDALHVEAFNHVFGPRGHVFDRARAAKELMGFSTASLAERFLPDQPPERQAAIMDEKEAVFRRLVSGKIQPMPGLMTLLAWADRAGIPMVAVTNAPRLNAEMLLAGLGIMDRFKALMIGDELSHAKPHPLPYLEGLRAVNASASLSVAFEDSRFLEQPHRPVDRRDRDVGVDGRGAGVEGLDVRMVLAVAEHARDDLALLGDAQALVRAQCLDVDRPGHAAKLGTVRRIVQPRRGDHFPPRDLRRLVPSPIDLASFRRCSA